MPEGDTIHKLAGFLRPRLQGQRLAGFRLTGDPTLDLAGALVEGVTARGKHLMIDLEGGWTLRTHLGMHGSWHAYARGERWKERERAASVVLATEGEVFVCFHAAEAELMRRRGARAAATERRLGPDLVAEEEPDLEEILRRARDSTDPATPVLDVLLDQRVACGIGNVYKSEALFLEGVHPLRTLQGLEDAVLGALYRTARELLRANLTAGPRTTRDAADGNRLWVYGRGGEPCLRCDARLQSARLGRGARPTTWCPRCQVAGSTGIDPAHARAQS